MPIQCGGKVHESLPYGDVVYVRSPHLPGFLHLENSLVIAAKKTMEAGTTSVMILDLDAHCGGGTASLIRGIPGIRQMDVSVTGFDCYG